MKQMNHKSYIPYNEIWEKDIYSKPSDRKLKSHENVTYVIWMILGVPLNCLLSPSSCLRVVISNRVPTVDTDYRFLLFHIAI